MRRKKSIHTFLTYLIAAVWVINGLICKLLDFVPRHQEIVSRILGNEYAEVLTNAIGASEVFMAIWVLSRIKPRLCAVVQIVIVAAMNTIEFFLAPDLLLFGKLNSLIALIFIAVVYYNEFTLNKKLT